MSCPPPLLNISRTIALTFSRTPLSFRRVIYNTKAQFRTEPAAAIFILSRRHRCYFTAAASVLFFHPRALIHSLLLFLGPRAFLGIYIATKTNNLTATTALNPPSLQENCNYYQRDKADEYIGPKFPIWTFLRFQGPFDTAWDVKPTDEQ